MMKNREEKMKKQHELTEAVLAIKPIKHITQMGNHDYSYCPMCNVLKFTSDGKASAMSDLPHKDTCPVLVALRLDAQ